MMELKGTWEYYPLLIFKDLLIHIMDLSHPDLLAQRDNVLTTLENLKIRQPLIDGILNVGNKLDKCDTARREQLMEWGILPKPDVEQGQKSPSIFPISCRTLEGIPMLIGHLDKVFKYRSISLGITFLQTDLCF
jgi:50S ribosomal subunit-associated GTPase HflX